MREKKAISTYEHKYKTRKAFHKKILQYIRSLATQTQLVVHKSFAQNYTVMAVHKEIIRVYIKKMQHCKTLASAT